MATGDTVYCCGRGHGKACPKAGLALPNKTGVVLWSKDNKVFCKACYNWLSARGLLKAWGQGKKTHIAEVAAGLKDA